MMYNHVLRISSSLRAIEIMEHSLITIPNAAAKIWKFLDFSADLTKSIVDFMANLKEPIT